MERLAEAIEDAEFPFPGAVRELGGLLFVQIAEPNEKIAELEKDLRERAREDEPTVRLMSVRESDGGGRWRSRPRAAVGELPSQPGLRSLAGAGSPAELDRREADAGEDTEDGSARPPVTVGRRRDGDSWLGRAARHEAHIAWALMTKNEYYRAPLPTA